MDILTIILKGISLCKKSMNYQSEGSRYRLDISDHLEALEIHASNMKLGFIVVIQKYTHQLSAI